MIIFDQLRISDDGKKLFLDAHVNTNTEYDDVYIDEITIFRDDEIIDTSMPPVSKCIYREVELQTKSVNRVLTLDDFRGFINTNELSQMNDLSHNIFFVYIDTDGEPDSSVSCADAATPVVGTTYNTSTVYQNGMNFVKELANDCSIPNGFINFILNNEALKASLGTGHFVASRGYYKTLLGLSGGSNSTITSKPCGCHG